MVAKILSVPNRAVSYYLKKYNIKIYPKKDSVLLDKNINNVIKDYKSGYTFSKLVNKYKYSIGKIYWILKIKNCYKRRKYSPKPEGFNANESNPKWNGGVKYDNKRKMLLITHAVNGKPIYEYSYRLLAEQQLGRKLRPGEIVHHIDGDVNNNSKENIEVLSSQGNHVRDFHIKRGRFCGTN